MISAYAIIGHDSFTRRAKSSELFNEMIFFYFINPDFLLITNLDGKSSISIDQIKEIASFLKHSPIQNEKKIVVIESAEMMTIEAQNSILKILEEPPRYATFVFEVDSNHGVLPTVMSRCAVIYTHNEQLEASLSVAILSAFSKLAKADLGARIDWVFDNKDLLKDKDFIAELSDGWETLIRDVILMKTDNQDFVVNKMNFQIIKSFEAENFAMEELVGFITKLGRLKKTATKTNANSQILLEEFLINL